MVIPSAIGAQTMLGNLGYSIYDQYKTIVAYIEIAYLPREN
jgi:hypothetical protein